MGHEVQLLHSMHTSFTKLLAVLSWWRKGKFDLATYHRHIVVPFIVGFKAMLLAKRGFHPDIIVAHDPFVVIEMSKLFPNVPIVQTIHGPLYEHALEFGYDPPLALKYLRQIEKLSFRIASAIIAVDSGQASLAVTKGAKPDKVKVVYNAIDNGNLRHLASIPLADEPDSPYIIIARRLVPKNGVSFGIEGFAESKAAQQTHLIIAGNGGEQDNLRVLVDKLGIGDKVTFKGFVPHRQVIRLISRAKASIIPSIPYKGVVEATSLTVLESLSLGIPVIASAIGGIAEIDGGVNCIALVPPQDPASIAKALDQIIIDEAPLVPQRVRVGKERVSAKFDATVWAQHMIEIYEEVLREANI
jgi:glycosyltransferase involved in cell wall biosynthesis